MYSLIRGSYLESEEWYSFPCFFKKWAGGHNTQEKKINYFNNSVSDTNL